MLQFHNIHTQLKKTWTLVFDTVKDMLTEETENNVAVVDNFKIGREKYSGRK